MSRRKYTNTLEAAGIGPLSTSCMAAATVAGGRLSVLRSDDRHFICQEVTFGEAMAQIAALQKEPGCYTDEIPEWCIAQFTWDSLDYRDRGARAPVDAVYRAYLAWHATAPAAPLWSEMEFTKRMLAWDETLVTDATGTYWQGFRVRRPKKAKRQEPAGTI